MTCRITKVTTVTRQGTSVGFRRATLVERILSAIFPYKPPSKIGTMLVCQKAITGEPGGALRG